MTESKTRDRKPKLDVDVSPFAVAEDLVKDLCIWTGKIEI